MIHEIHCLRCNRQLIEPVEMEKGRMHDVSRIPPGILFDEASGRYSRTCPHCGAKNLFREHEVPGKGMTLLLDRLAE